MSTTDSNVTDPCKVVTGSLPAQMDVYTCMIQNDHVVSSSGSRDFQFGCEILWVSIFVNVRQFMPDSKFTKLPPRFRSTKYASDRGALSRRGRATDNMCVFNQVKPTFRGHIGERFVYQYPSDSF